MVGLVIAGAWLLAAIAASVVVGRIVDLRDGYAFEGWADDTLDVFTDDEPETFTAADVRDAWTMGVQL